MLDFSEGMGLNFEGGPLKSPLGLEYKEDKPNLEAKSTTETSRNNANREKEAESIAGDSIADSNIQNMNKIFIQNLHSLRAKEIWEMGKRLGISAKGDEKEVIDYFHKMEERDRKGWEEKL
ncbi:hypothetical protein Ancab_014256 [Ancistrocladus abbreviatus]